MPTTKDNAAISAEFDRIARLPDGGWNHNAHYHPFLLSHFPAHTGSALDVGCGAGSFTRLMAERCDSVVGIDLSPVMIERARAESTGYPNLRFEVADVMARDSPEASFDCIASIATLHHLPLDTALARLKAWLKPNGVLLVLDLVKGQGLELVKHGVAMLIDPIMKRWHGTAASSHEANEAWKAHGNGERYNTIREVRGISRNLLPGAVVKTHLYYRYSLVWRK
jgi:SAM-dependent methyltransferase